MKRFEVKAIEVVGIDNKYLFKINSGVEVPQDFSSQDALFKYIILKLLGYEIEVVPLDDTKDKEGQTDD